MIKTVLPNCTVIQKKKLSADEVMRYLVFFPHTCKNCCVTFLARDVQGNVRVHAGILISAMGIWAALVCYSHSA